MALGGRWGRLNGENAQKDDSSESDATVESAEAEVVEASEVRTESDPWQD